MMASGPNSAYSLFLNVLWVKLVFKLLVVWNKQTVKKHMQQSLYLAKKT